MKSYRDALPSRPGFPIRRPLTIDRVEPTLVPPLTGWRALFKRLFA